mmetsp:Transcript_48893/g.115449  ORF Transcript_48893/g.115449 Transcript_48893/m.115449 type:complete len:125 (+) Transcript_48893:3-377(+)
MGPDPLRASKSSNGRKKDANYQSVAGYANTEIPVDDHDLLNMMSLQPGTYSDRRGAPRHLPSVLQPPSGAGGAAAAGQPRRQDEPLDKDVNSYFSKSSLPHGLNKAIGASPAEKGRLGTSGGMR